MPASISLAILADDWISNACHLSIHVSTTDERRVDVRACMQSLGQMSAPIFAIFYDDQLDSIYFRQSTERTSSQELNIYSSEYCARNMI